MLLLLGKICRLNEEMNENREPSFKIPSPHWCPPQQQQSSTHPAPIHVKSIDNIILSKEVAEITAFACLNEITVFTQAIKKVGSGKRWWREGRAVSECKMMMLII